MNDPPPQENENSLDIFVLSPSGTSDSDLKAALEQDGYQVTLFNDCHALIDALSLGKPNLLICDTCSKDTTSYDLCRHLKAHRDLWVIPVLMMTETSDLSDVLSILDCNADNYISLPFDPAYLRALVEGMVSVPVERPTPDQIKTQFKVQHNDRIFVITADRRKLLEFLLSSFEIAVVNHDEIMRLTDQVRILNRDVMDLGNSTAQNKQTIRALSETIAQKEAEQGALRSEIAEKERIIADNRGHIETLESDLGTARALLSVAQEKICTLTQEMDLAAQSHEEKVGELHEKISRHARDLDVLSEEHGNVKSDFQQAMSRCLAAESDLESLQVIKTRQDQEIADLRLKVAQLGDSLLIEKDAVEEAKKQVESIQSLKEAADRDLGREIAVHKENLLRSQTELASMEATLADAQARVSSLDVQVSALEKEKELAEAEAGARIEELQARLADLQVQYNSSAAELEDARNSLALFKASADESRAELGKNAEHAETLSQELKSVRSMLEAEQAARGRLDEKNRALNAELEKGRDRISGLAAALESANRALAEEKEDRRSSEQSLKALIADRDSEVLTVSGDNENLKRELSLRQDEMDRVRSDMTSILHDKTDLEKSLEQARSEYQELEQELKVVSSGHAQTGQQVRSLGDELEQLRVSLETERRLRRVAEENLQSALSAHERSRSDFGNIVEERRNLGESLENERTLRRETEDLNRSLEEELALLKERLDHSEKQFGADASEYQKETQSLASEITALREHSTSLESELALLRSEKDAAETKISTLSSEIEQARSALADEWEDHMNDQERLLTVPAGSAPPRSEVSSQNNTAVERPSAKRAIIVKGPDLPAVVRPSPMVKLAFEQSLHEAAAISRVEDLFEDEAASGSTESVSTAPQSFSPVTSVSGEVPSMAVSPEPMAGNPAETDPPLLGVGDDVPETELADSFDPDDFAAGKPDELQHLVAQSGLAFTRAQWFDLIRWSHHSGALSQEQRMQIVRMGRLIQRGRKLTQKQEEQVREMVAHAQALGYQIAR